MIPAGLSRFETENPQTAPLLVAMKVIKLFILNMLTKLFEFGTQRVTGKDKRQL
jgi:hypothetical protein